MILDGFDDIEHIKKEYQISDFDLDGINLLYAAYSTGYCDGSSIVMFEKDKKLFIIDAGHCSCYGLEGQWNPDETSEEVLKKEIKAKSNYKFEEFESFIIFCTEYFKWK